MQTLRGAASVLLAVGVATMVPALAHAQSGSIADVHDIGGGKLAATFSATSTECTSFGFCGWFPVAWQVAGAASCAPNGSNIVYVGTYQDTAGTQTAVDSFYSAFDPLRLCLYINGSGGEYELVAETVYAAPPPPPAPPVPPPPPVVGPALISPPADARLPAASSISFRARSPERYDDVTIEVSRSNALDADGTLVGSGVIDSGDGFDGETIRLDGGWMRHPGIYYWQASRIACNVTASDCDAESEVRRLEIIEPPLDLTFAVNGRQQLHPPRRGDAFNNLIVKLGCNRTCRVRLRGSPTFRAYGSRHAVRGLGLNERFAVRGGKASRYGFRLTAAGRARLIAVMREHGPVRWRLEVRATTEDGDARRLTRFIQMTPPPLPKPRPAPSPQPFSPSCDPSYPGVCIPPPPPDLDCGDIPYSGFTVVGSDPHGFDGDGDGVGCE